MATDKEVKIEDQGSYDEPTQADKDLTALLLTIVIVGVITEIPTSFPIG